MSQLIVDIDESLATARLLALLPSLRAAFTEADAGALVLALDDHGLGLRDPTERTAPTRVDFLAADLQYRLRTSGKRQGVAKAVGLDKVAAHRRLRVVDATAGLGRDAAVLAHLGCDVTMLEQNPVMHALLADGLERALAQAEAGFRDVLQRLQLIHIDACHWLMTAGQQQVPDVVYLDPMFPPRDKTAKVKKDMALLHRLLGSAQDLHSLLDTALTVARHRVVLKRPDGRLPPGLPAPTLWIGEQPAAFAVYVNSSFSSMH